MQKVLEETQYPSYPPFVPPPSLWLPYGFPMASLWLPYGALRRLFG